MNSKQIPQIIDRCRKKAVQSGCNHKIGLLGFNKRGEIIFSCFNRSRFPKKSGGIHSEMYAMLKCGKKLKTILICRVNSSGKLLIIHPCKMCAEKAKELKIKIITVQDLI